MAAHSSILDWLNPVDFQPEGAPYPRNEVEMGDQC